MIPPQTNMGEYYTHELIIPIDGQSTSVGKKKMT